MKTNERETAQRLTKAGLKLKDLLNIATVSDTANESTHIGMCTLIPAPSWYE